MVNEYAENHPWTPTLLSCNHNPCPVRSTGCPTIQCGRSKVPNLACGRSSPPLSTPLLFPGMAPLHHVGGRGSSSIENGAISDETDCTFSIMITSPGYLKTADRLCARHQSWIQTLCRCILYRSYYRLTAIRSARSWRESWRENKLRLRSGPTTCLSRLHNLVIMGANHVPELHCCDLLCARIDFASCKRVGRCHVRTVDRRNVVLPCESREQQRRRKN